ncbi:MAG TPA: M12 family metallo-peptidase [Candidatus Brocadiales bacterium]|nr:M12 family metallo-peptidase [Candidatus Brocadiales bacterium]
MKFHIRIVTGVTILFLATWVNGLLGAQPTSDALKVLSYEQNDNLFKDVQPFAEKYIRPKILEREKEDPAIVRKRYVQVNFDLLRKKDSIAINLFEGLSFVGIKDRIETRSTDRYTWYGHIEGIEHSQIIIVVEDGNTSGDIVIPEGLYQIRSVGGGVHAIYEIDQSAFPPCADPIPIEIEDTPFEPRTVPRDDGSIIDILVVYTQAAANAYGNINSEIQLSIDISNLVYSNSLITQRLRLVGTAQVAYTETGSASTDLGRLKNPSDGYMDNVHTLRNTYNADLVSLFVSRIDACGIAYIMCSVSKYFASSGFSVVETGCSSVVLAHELGHNMGADHDRDNSGGCRAYSYSYGYQEPNGSFRTIMAYPNGCTYPCPRILHFSNPLVSYNGIPTGIPQGQPNSADNTTTFNNTAYTIANFRQSSECIAEACNDGVDNDCDGLKDCDDPDCADAPICECLCPDDSLLGCISGKVTNELTGSPLRKKVILKRIFPESIVRIGRVETGDNGCYLFSDLVDGKYKVKVRDCSPLSSSRQIVEIIGGAKLNDVNFQCQ